MKIKSVFDKEFVRYGYVLEDYDFSELIEKMEAVSQKPEDHVIYEPGCTELEALPVARQMQENLYGGMPIEVGYCNGFNNKLNCLEYHRGSEVNIAADDVVLLLAPMQEVVQGKLDTSKVEAFALPRGKAALLYETSMHYAPARASGSYRVAIVLPKGTNVGMPDISPVGFEDKLLRGRNKWLIAHPESAEAKDGAFAGLSGENITLSE